MSEKSRVEELVIQNNINVSDMKNKERKLQFIEATYPNAKDHSVIPIIRKFNQYGKIETEFEKDLMEFSMQDFIKFFEMFPWTYSSFMGNKSIIKGYLDWGRDNELTSNFVCRTLESIDYSKPSHRKMFEKYYFKNFQDLQDTIEFYKAKCKRNSSKLKFALCEIIIHLAWSGIELQDILSLKITDMNRNTKQVYIERLDKYVTLDSMIFSNMFFYVTLKEDDTEEYVESDRIIRTKDIGELSSSYVASLLSRMMGNNESNVDIEDISDNEPKVINYQKVYYSGLYYRAMLDEKVHGQIYRANIERLNELFNENFIEGDDSSSVAISKRLIDYTDYLKYMYREEFYRK
jgi:hypothetical protein